MFGAALLKGLLAHRVRMKRPIWPFTCAASCAPRPPVRIPVNTNRGPRFSAASRSSLIQRRLLLCLLLHVAVKRGRDGLAGNGIAAEAMAAGLRPGIGSHKPDLGERRAGGQYGFRREADDPAARGGERQG